MESGLVYALARVSEPSRAFVEEITKVRENGKTQRWKTGRRAYEIMLGMEYLVKPDYPVDRLYRFLKVPAGLPEEQAVILSRALLYAVAEMVGKSRLAGTSPQDMEFDGYLRSPRYRIDESGRMQQLGKVENAIVNILHAYASSLKGSSREWCRKQGEALAEAIRKFSIQDAHFLRDYQPERADLQPLRLAEMRAKIHEYEMEVLSKLNACREEGS